MNCFPRTPCNSQLILITSQYDKGGGNAWVTKELAGGHTGSSITDLVSNSHFVVFSAKCNPPST